MLAAAIVMALCAPGSATFAQEVQELDEAAAARLTLAHEIVDIAYPPEQEKYRFGSTLELLRTRIDAENEFDDPQVDAIISKHRQAFFAQAQVTLSNHLPRIRELLEHGFADEFTLDELRAIREFLVGPVGPGFFDRTAAIAEETGLAAANQALADELLAIQSTYRVALFEELEELSAQREAADIAE